MTFDDHFSLLIFDFPEVYATFCFQVQCTENKLYR